MNYGHAVTTIYRKGKIRATAPGGHTVFVAYDHRESITNNHREAALKAWSESQFGSDRPGARILAYAGSPTDDGYVFVFAQ